MKKLIIFTLVLLCLSCRTNKKKIDQRHIDNINQIIENEKIVMTIEVYEKDIEYMKNKYKILPDNNIVKDISKNKILYEMCVEDIHILMKDGKFDNERNNLLNKWFNNHNYNPKFHFIFEDNYKYQPSLSFLKAMDFYNSKDLNIFLKSLKDDLINKYLSGNHPEINFCIENNSYSNWKIWERKNNEEIRPIKDTLNKINSNK